MSDNPVLAEKKSIDSENIIAAIKNAKTAVVTAHVSPDGDTLASMLALARILESFGLETVHRVMHDEVPSFYKFFPDQEKVLCSMKDADREKLLEEYDISFSCDCGSVQRLGSAGLIWQKAKLTCNVDHHLSNPLYADLNWVDVNATCTGQVVKDIMLDLNKLIKAESLNNGTVQREPLSINEDLATLLFITLLTDTGGFRHSNTNAEVFTWAAELTNQGAEPSKLFNLLFNQMPFRTIKVIGAALDAAEIIELDISDLISGEIIPKNKLRIAYTTTTKELLTKLSAKEEDTDEIVDHLMRIKDINMCIYLREDTKSESNFKGSLRSLCEIDCSKIANQLNGGGHARAAGFNCSAKSFHQLKSIVLEKIAEHIKGINKN
ncbi:MAG: DHH family phosphoesterase [Candidatus Melainabacteria bacterium]|nr:DHH family phosphoesterase [Candidatus Melainabacteria bacterium]